MSSGTIDNLIIKIDTDAGSAASALERLAVTLERIKTATKGGIGLTAVSKQLVKLNEAVSQIKDPGNKLQLLADALKPLYSLGKSNLGSVLNSLQRLPEISRQLGAMDFTAFANNIRKVLGVLNPLAKTMNQISAGFAKFPAKIQKVAQGSARFAQSNKQAHSSLGGLNLGLTGSIAKLGIFYYAVRRVTNVVADWIHESNDYVENLNLFEVAMGDASGEALKYAEAVQSALGIDPSEFIRNQGIFKQITSGYGVATEKANLMSKSLTQVGYDLSSLFNISIEDSMQKVQSGIAGELEPLRRLGFALDQATLQQIAYDNGIKQNIATMTQAQKSQLRFIAIMDQSKKAQGDMARTIMSPANALRILGQQITQLKRALGNIFIPMLQVALPYLQAFVTLLTRASQAFANLLGFKLPEFDYSGLESVGEDGEDVANSLAEATDAAKKFQASVLGFDQLNIMSAPKESGGSEGGGGNFDLPLDLSAYDYDFLGDAKSKTQEIVAQMENAFKKIRGFAVTAGEGIGSFFVQNLLPVFDIIWNYFEYTLIPGLWNAGIRGMEGLGEIFGTGFTLIQTVTTDALGVVTEKLPLLLTEAGEFFNGTLNTLVTAFDTVKTIFGGVLDVLLDLWNRYGKDTLGSIWNFVIGIYDSFNLILNGRILPMINYVLEVLKNLWEDHLQKLVFRIGEFVMKLVSAATDIWTGFFKPIYDWITEKLTPIFMWLWRIIVDVVGWAFGVISDTFSSIIRIASGLLDFIAGVFTLDWDRAWEGIQNIFGGIWERITQIFVSGKELFKLAWKWIKEPFEGAYDWFVGIFTDIRDGIVSVFSRIGEFLKQPLNGVISILNSVISRVNTISIDIPDWIPGIGGNSFGISIPRIPMLATGGMPDIGEMFIAREAGPEMVGSIGRRTAVANNAQIVEAVSTGVAKAVKAVMGKDEGDQTINLYIDGVYERTIETQRRKNIRAGQVLVPVGV
jgi:phage-related protein